MKTILSVMLALFLVGAGTQVVATPLETSTEIVMTREPMVRDAALAAFADLKLTVVDDFHTSMHSIFKLRDASGAVMTVDLDGLKSWTYAHAYANSKDMARKVTAAIQGKAAKN